MKFAIVSDTHDNLANFNKVIDFLNKEKIGVMLHCGDVCTQDTINEAEKRFNGEILFVKGNGDYNLEPHNGESPYLKKNGNYKMEHYKDAMEAEIGGKKIAFVHYPELAKKMAEGGNYDLVFHGHTHKPWMERVGNPSTDSSNSPQAGSGRVCILANPGELAGQRFKPTFAIYDTDTGKLELKILEKM